MAGAQPDGGSIAVELFRGPDTTQVAGILPAAGDAAPDLHHAGQHWPTAGLRTVNASRTWPATTALKSLLVSLDGEERPSHTTIATCGRSSATRPGRRPATASPTS